MKEFTMTPIARAFTPFVAAAAAALALTSPIFAAEKAAPAAAPAKAAPAPAAAEAPAEAAPADAAPEAQPAEAAPAAAEAAPAEAAPAAAEAEAAPAAEQPAAAEAPAEAAPAAEAPAKAAAAAPAGAITSKDLVIGTPVMAADGVQIGEVNRVTSDASGKVSEIHVTAGGPAGLNAKVVSIPAKFITAVGKPVKVSISGADAKKLPILDNNG